MLVVLFVLACLGGIAWGASHVREVDENGDVVADGGSPADVEITGDEELVSGATTLPPGLPSEEDVIEQTFPSESAEILQQQQIGIDLGSAYWVVNLYVDRTLIPEGEVTRRNELNQAFFTPGEDRTFDVLPPGRVCAQADIADIQRRDTVVRQVEWCFEVT
jgi:hypothetical protein